MQVDEENQDREECLAIEFITRLQQELNNRMQAGQSK
jgi:hypothetical protein